MTFGNGREFGPYPMNESEIGPYHLPDPLEKEDGTHVATADEWTRSRRGELLSLFMREEYGQILPKPDRQSYELLSRRDDALGGSAIRKEILLRFEMENGRSHEATLLLYLPKKAHGPVPAFLGLNFLGNHNTTLEADVRKTGFLTPGKLDCQERGRQAYRWCFRDVIGRGYASATICYHDFYPDTMDATERSVFRLFFDQDEYDSIGRHHSIIGAWAWGLSRGLDYLETETAIDATRVAVHGHSRLGKTSLWAGATDPRFAMVIANDSGCGGATLHRRTYGENLSQHFEWHRAHGMPVWFVDRCKRYVFREGEMPVDQHELLALIAPRPLSIGTASDDQMADPHGEYLSCLHASPVYELFGASPFPAGRMVKPGGSISGTISFHLRAGNHDQTPWDWERYLDAADRSLRRRDDG